MQMFLQCGDCREWVDPGTHQCTVRQQRRQEELSSAIELALRRLLPHYLREALIDKSVRIAMVQSALDADKVRARCAPGGADISVPECIEAVISESEHAWRVREKKRREEQNAKKDT